MVSSVSSAKRILYVDNSFDSCELMSFVLTELGHSISTAQTITEGLNLARNSSFDLYLLDTSFSDGTGFELSEQIRAFNQTTPIIFCTANVRDDVQQAAAQVGAQGVLLKPIDIDQLAGIVAQWTAS
jgi:OmpR-family two-component system manganese-sensing response regulator